MKNFSKVALVSVIGAILYGVLLTLTGQPPNQAVRNALIVGGSVFVVGTLGTFFYPKS